MHYTWKCPQNIEKLRRRIREMAPENVIRDMSVSVWDAMRGSPEYRWIELDELEFLSLVYCRISFVLDPSPPIHRKLRFFELVARFSEKRRCRNCRRLPPEHDGKKCLFEPSEYAAACLT